jgi:hypothetical protein
LVLAPERETQTDEYGSHVGNTIFWDGTEAGLDQMRRMMPECRITCSMQRPQNGETSRHGNGLEKPTLTIDYPGGEVEYAEAG